MNEDFNEFNKTLNYAREISRSAIYKIIILSASIVGFSVSLFSIPVMQSNLDLNILRYSWYFFLATIIIGFFILIFEGRIKYAIAWKGFQPSNCPQTYKEYFFKEKLYASLIVILSLFYPANLISNKVYEKDEDRIFNERVNGLVVNKLAWTAHILIFIENILFIIFIWGLIFLISSFNL
jgi:hypothetical protein